MEAELTSMLGIDNFSRRILAWKVSATFDPTVTAELLLHSARHLTDTKPTLLVDGGVENFNGAVNELVGSCILKRLLAQTERNTRPTMPASRFQPVDIAGAVAATLE